jgi:hypothetical protein
VTQRLTIIVLLLGLGVARADTLLPYSGDGVHILILPSAAPGCGLLQLDYSDTSGCNAVGIGLGLP